MKPEEKKAQKRENEYSKMEKLLATVRHPDPKQKQDKNKEIKEKKEDKN